MAHSKQKVISVITETLGWSEGDLRQVAEALGLDEDQAESINLKFSAEEWANNAKIRESVAYIGFDPKKIAEQFFKKAAENSIGENDRLEDYNGVKLYEKNDARTDLMFFLNTFLERGNNLYKALLRCDEVIAPILRRKANAYGIVLEKTQNKTILGTRHLTLARLAQAFAQCTAALILKDKIKSKLVSKLFVNPPFLMTHTVFPALIPNDGSAISDQLKSMAVFLNIEMSMMLSDAKEKRKMAVKTLEELYERSLMFVEAAMNGSLIHPTARVAIMIKAEILKLDGKALGMTEEMKIQIERLNLIRANQMHNMTYVLSNLGN